MRLESLTVVGQFIVGFLGLGGLVWHVTAFKMLLCFRELFVDVHLSFGPIMALDLGDWLAR